MKKKKAPRIGAFLKLKIYLDLVSCFGGLVDRVKDFDGDDRRRFGKEKSGEQHLLNTEKRVDIRRGA